jgi:FtsP/CotA-like multicopper oxidase with cupredoxin domain
MNKHLNGVRSGAMRSLAGLALVLALGPGCNNDEAWLKALPEFKDPDKFQPDAEGVYKLSVGPAEVTIADKRYCLRSYNGKLTAPTLSVPASSEPRRIRLDFENKFQKEDSQPVGASGPEFDFNTTNLHTHGLHVSPGTVTGDPTLQSDNVLLEIKPGQPAVPYRFDIDEKRTHQPGTFWYHAHVHGSTAIQVANGMAGALIIEGKVDELAGIREARPRIFLFQQIPYDADDVKPLAVGQTCDESNLSINDFKLATKAKTTLINGQKQPRITVPPGQVERWRFIHAGVSQFLNVSVYKAEKGDCSTRGTLLTAMQQIAADGITFQQKEKKQQLLLAPGYRADVMFEAPTEEGTYCIVDDKSPKLNPADPQDTGTEPPNLLAVVQVDKSAGPRTGGLPSDDDLSAVALPPLECKEPAPPSTQKVIFAQKVDDVTGQQCEGNGFFNINCKTYEMDMEPRLLTLGKTDDWELSSQAGRHPFHIHVNHFTVCPGTADGEQITRPHWRDTLMIEAGPNPVRVRTTYEDFTGDFVMHCHLLQHEDQGMMELMRITEGTQP